MMRRIVFSLAVLFVSLLSAKAQAITLNEIDFWVGSGPNEAALIIDWKDGKSPQALAWGFRWDGVATVGDMIQAIAGTTQIRAADSGAFIADVNGADPRLFVRMSQHSFGNAIFGLGYDVDGDGASYITGLEGTETGSAVDPDDHYVEGWFNEGYWFGVGGTGAGGFDFNEFVYDSLALTDGNIYGLAFDDDFSTFLGGSSGDEPQSIVAAPAPTQSNGVPEPASLVMLGMSALALMTRRR